MQFADLSPAWRRLLRLFQTINFGRVEELEIRNGEPGQAKRNPVDFDYTVLYRPFLHAMAQIGHYGASKYGYDNWKRSPLVHDKSPQNHLEGHLTELAEGRPHDHFHTLRHQIAAIGFNAMMMFYWMEREELELEGEQGGGQGPGVGVNVDDLKGAR